MSKPERKHKESVASNAGLLQADSCAACGEFGPRFQCRDCSDYFHCRCLDEHHCMEPDDGGYYDSRGHWVK